MLSDKEIDEVFESLVGRKPESATAYGHFRDLPGALDLVHIILKSHEFGRRVTKSPFEHFNSRIDAEAIVRAHEAPDRKPRAGFKVNYFGVAIPNGVIPTHALGQVPDLEFDPIPANWHADTAEFAAALRAVDLARERFTMIELGCGWGCWMNITGAAARQRGLKPKLIGIEGDGKNLNLAREALAANGFAEDEVSLMHGIAHARSGKAAFPQQGDDEEHWGLEPIFSSDEQAYREAMASGRYAELPMFGFRDIAEDHGRIDLLHVDIQGGEADLVEECIDIFSDKIAYVLIGSHAREIEGRTFAAFRRAGWVLEIERPAILSLSNAAAGPQVVVDGVQGWLNPRLT